MKDGLKWLAITLLCLAAIIPSLVLGGIGFIAGFFAGVFGDAFEAGIEQYKRLP